MKFNIGDTVFSRNGRPGVIIDRDPLTAQHTVEKRGETYEKARARNFLNGMTPAVREDFNQIMDQIRSKPEVEERVTSLNSQIETLKEDPRKLPLTRYLTAELVHMMNSEHIHPDVYKTDGSDLR